MTVRQRALQPLPRKKPANTGFWQQKKYLIGNTHCIPYEVLLWWSKAFRIRTPATFLLKACSVSSVIGDIYTQGIVLRFRLT